MQPHAHTAHAQPAGTLSHFAGYGNASFGQAYLPPPPPCEQPTPPGHQDIVFKEDAFVTEESAREYLLDFVSQNCCFGSRPAREMKITDIRPFSTYHYVLESFCEGRETKLQCEPYKVGQLIDGPENGPAPPPWSIPAQPAKMFQDSVKKIEVPHTAMIKPCHACMATGYKDCTGCDGRGQITCLKCNGEGHCTVEEFGETRVEECTSCFGRGVRNCETCTGNGQVKCGTCQGNKYVKTFIELTVKWQVRKDNRMVKRTHEIPDQLIEGSEGTELFSQEEYRVWPLTTFHDAAVNNISKELIQRHSTQFTAERILMQRHKLRQVPVSEVHYKYKEIARKFWVCGHNHQIHAPDYPEKCCCGCCGCVLL